VYANAVIVGAIVDVTLTAGEGLLQSVEWDTMGFDKGGYAVSAVVDHVSEETNIDDNTRIDGGVIVTIVGDVDGEGEVDVSDLYIMGSAYQSDPMGSSWNPNCDFDNSNSVDASDLSDLNENYGEVGA